MDGDLGEDVVQMARDLYVDCQIYPGMFSNAVSGKPSRSVD